MQPDQGKTIPTDAGDLSRLLEIELEQKRIEWKRSRSRYRALRSVGFTFLFLVIAGALLAFLFLFSRANEQRANYPRAETHSVSRP